MRFTDEHPIPILGRRIDEQVLVLDRRVRDEGVRAAQLGGACDHALDVVRACDVAGDRLAAAARSRDLLDGASRAVLVDVGAQRERSGGSEAQRDGAADARPGAGHDRDLSVHLHLALLLRARRLRGCLY